MPPSKTSSVLKGTTETALLPSPQLLLEFARIDPSLPEIVTKAGIEESRQGYVYALVGLIAATLLALAVVGGFIYLVVQGYPRSASGLLGTGVLTLIGSFLRSRYER